MTTATSLQPGTLLQQREIYLSILKDLTIMDDIFMRNVLKDSACTEYILKVIMDQDNLKLEDQILQADYKNLQGRSSILDCIALDNSGRKYNIEFQNAVKRCLFEKSPLSRQLSGCQHIGNWSGS